MSNNIELNEKKEIRDFNKHLSHHFISINGAFAYLDGHDSGGIWGVTLKSVSETHRNGKSNGKAGDNRKRIVYKVDTETGSIVHEYPSLSECSMEVGQDMYYKIVRKVHHTDGYLYTYEKPCNCTT